MSYYDEWKKNKGNMSSNTTQSKTSYYEEWKKRIAAEEMPNTPDWSTYDIDSARADLEQKQATYDKYYTDVDSWRATVNDSKIRLIDVERQLNQTWGLTSKQRQELENEANGLRSNISVGEKYISSIDLTTPKQSIDKLKKEIEDAQAWQDKKAREDETNRLYEDIIASPDYEEITQKHESDSFYEGSIGDLLKKTYGAIFNPQNAGNRITAANATTEYDPKTMTSYNSGAKDRILPKVMNEKEQLVYNAYYYRGEYDKAEEYYKSIEGDLEERARSVANTNAANFAKAQPFWSSAQSIGHSVFGTPTEAAVDLIKYGIDAVKDPTTAKLDRNDIADTVNITRQTVSEDMTPVGRFFYNTTMSGLDSLLSGLAFGNVAGVTLALSAGSSAYNEGLDRGMSSGQAMAYGVASGLFEGIFESWSLGNLEALKEISPKTWKDVVLNIAKSMGVNASEEMATEIANIAYDAIFNGQLSNYQEMLDSGMTEWEALGQFTLQVLEAGASGALMGFGFGGVGSAIGYFNNKGADTVADIQNRMRQSASENQMYISFQNKVKDSEVSTALVDIVKGREVKNSDLQKVIGNEAALSLLNETLGTDIKAENSLDEARDIISKAFESSEGKTPAETKIDRNRVVKSLEVNLPSEKAESFATIIADIGNGNEVSDKQIASVLNNKYARNALNKYLGRTVEDKFTESSKASDVRAAMAEGDYSRQGQAVLFGATLGMSENAIKGLSAVVANSHADVASIARAYNVVYKAAKSGKALADVSGVEALSPTQKLIAYEYGVMDGLVEQSESKKKATEEAEYTKESTTKDINEEAEFSRESEVDEGAIVTKGGETIVPVKENTAEQTRIIDMGKKLGVEVAFGKITKTGKNIDGLFDGKVLYINTKTTSGKSAYILFKHEFTHFLEKSTKYINFAKAVTESKAFSEWLKKNGYKNSTEYYAKIIADYKQIGKNLEMGGAQKEAIANFCAEMLFADDNSMQRFVDTLSPDHKRTFGEIIRDFIEWLKRKLGKGDEIAMLEKKYAEVFQSKKVDARSFVAETKDTQANFTYAEEHKQKLSEKYSSSAAVDLTTLEQRYDKILEIWERLGGQLDSKFLNEWNSKVGKDRAFTVFKAQSGYKYNVELSSMCKKGVPLFEAIDTIVKEEAMKELKVNKLGKAEKEILYDLLKTDGFDIPCAICYVEQARQREGDIINAFLNGNEDGKVGWNQVLHECEEKMRATGVDYRFPALDRSVATDKYVPTTVKMTESEQNAFYEALKEIANREITKYNELHQNEKKFKPRKLVTSLTPAAINDVFKGNISADLKIFKVLFQNPDSRFTIESDLLYASTTTHNLAYAHNALYSLFNQQGGVSGYKTKQGNVVYWGDILDKKWEASKLRKEGGIRYQSNSDSQMYTLLDQVQMFIDLTAKGYYLQSYSKVLSYLKLLGLSKGKINASLIPKVVVYRDADGNVDWARTQENAGLDENGNPIYDDIEGINHEEAFMLIKDAEYSKSVGGVCIGYSDNHIRTLLDDPRIQLIIGYHDKTNNPDKRYRGARYAKNYNGINEAVDSEGKTVHIGFNQYVRQAEGMFTKVGEGFEGTTTHNGKTYDANDIPRLAADLYLEMCAKKGYTPAYNIEGIVDHPNYYKLLADFSLYDSKGNYAPHQKVEYNMPDQVPYLDENGHKRYMSAERYIRNELQKELKVRDDIAEKLADKSEAGLIPRFIKAVNGERVADASEMVGDETQYAYTPSPAINAMYQQEYDQAVDDVLNGTYKADVVVMGQTPKILEDIGLPQLPLLITPAHIYSVAKTEAEAKAEGRYHKNTNYHGFGDIAVKEIRDKLSDPIMVLAHQEFTKDQQNNHMLNHRIVVLVDLSVNGKQVICPIEVSAEMKIGNDMFDSNIVVTYFDKNDINSLIKEATAKENIGETGFYYINTKKANTLLQGSGYQLPQHLASRMSASDVIIRHISQNVNTKIQNILQSQQFIRWFGDWINAPDSASKIVNPDGTPRKMYHGTNAFIRIFDSTKISNTTKRYIPAFYFTSEPRVAEKLARYRSKTGGGDPNVMEVYLDVKNPLVLTAREYQRIGFDNKWREEILQKLKDNKHDGVIIYPEAERVPGVFEDSYNYEVDESVYANADKYGITDDDYAWWLQHAVSNTDFTAMQVAIFNSNQAKSTSNRGTYDGGSDDVYYSYTPDSEAASTREILANMMEPVAESETEQRLLAKYKGYLERIGNDKSEISRLREERKNASKAKKKVFTSKIEALERDISDTERRLSKLEEMATIKRLVERERAKLADEALLAGQMAQGRKDSEKLHRAIQLTQQRFRKKEQRAYDKRHTLDTKEKIAKTVKKLDSLLRHGTKEKNIHYGLQDAVASALEIIDINAEKTIRYNKAIAELQRKLDDAIAREDETDIEAYKAALEKKKKNFSNFEERLEKMRKAYAEIRDGKGEEIPPYYREEAKVIEGIIEETIGKIGGVLYEDMNLEQLEQVYKMYKVILTTVQNANKVFKGDKLADLVEDAAKIEHDLGDIKKLKEERWIGAEGAREYIWNELTPYYAFNRIGSEALMEYYWDLVRGQNVYANDINEARNFAQSVRKKYGYKNWDLDKTYTIKDKNGKDFSLNLRHMMSIYAYSKREQAKDHMEKGGFFFNDKETFRKDKKGLLHFIRSNETGYKVDEGVMTSILELMAEIDENTIAYVDEMQEYLTKMGEKGNEVTRKMWGIDIFKEKFYFPLKSKEDFIYQANTPAETSSLKNDGMTKETKPHASNPIVLEAFDSVWDQHVEKMSKYHAFVIPIDNLNKVINYGTWTDGDSKSITTMIRERYSSAAVEYLNTFIKDLNGAKAQRVMGWTFLTNLVTKFKKTAVAASMSVVVQQPTAIIRALSEIDAKYFLKLPKAMGLNAKWELIQKHAPVAIIKDIGGYDAGGGRSVIDWMSDDTKRGIDKAMSKVDNLTMYGAALGDRLGWGAIWTAVENEIADTTNLERGSEEFYEAVGKRFTEVIVKTQVYDSTLSRSGFMRGKDGLIKMAMAFKGEPTLSINMIIDAILQANRGKISKKHATRTIAAVYTSIIAANLAKSLIYALRDDDEDESYLEKYGQAIGSNIISDMLPITMLPIFSDIWSVLEGYTLERTDMSLIVDLYNAFTSLDSENKTTYRKIEDLAGAMGGLLGIPAKNILRSFREGYNVFENIFDGVDFGDIGKAFAEGVTGNEASKSESLYNAVMNKDTARINIYRGDYKDESTYTSALKRSLRENDPRVVKSVERALLGDYTLYNNSKRAISSTSKYGVKLVNEAFADERDYVLEKLDAARKARKAGNMTEYNKIIDQLVARGYSRAFILKKLK